MSPCHMIRATTVTTFFEPVNVRSPPPATHLLIQDIRLWCYSTMTPYKPQSFNVHTGSCMRPFISNEGVIKISVESEGIMVFWYVWIPWLLYQFFETCVSATTLHLMLLNFFLSIFAQIIFHIHLSLRIYRCFTPEWQETSLESTALTVLSDAFLRCCSFLSLSLDVIYFSGSNFGLELGLVVHSKRWLIGRRVNHQRTVTDASDFLFAHGNLIYKL